MLLHSSPALVSAHEVGMRRVSPDTPSTSGKHAYTSKTLPIDHALVNRALWDAVVSSTFRYDLPLADHFPLVTSFLSSDTPIPTWEWPAPVRNLPRQVCVQDVPFPEGARTYVEWSEQARNWIQDSYLLHVPSKVSRVAVLPRKKPVMLPLAYARIYKLVSAITHVQKLDNPQSLQIRSLNRRKSLEAFDITWDQTRESLDDLLEQARQILSDTCKNLHEGLMTKWKSKVRSWTIQGPEIHRYVRNDIPPRPLAISIHGQVTNRPDQLIAQLNDFWLSVESWPQPDTEMIVWDTIEDRFCAFLPHIPCSVTLTAPLLMNHIKYMKKGTHGCDAWSVDEIKTLPLPAWEAFVHLYNTTWPTNAPELLTLKKRTPIEKVTTGVPEPNQVRPIDVFSTLLRATSSCLCAMLRTWIRQVTHKSQIATHGGILHALTEMACWTECVLNRLTPIYAFSLDLSMMFNMLSATISGSLARVAGLDDSTVCALVWPLLASKSVWKLPRNVVNQLLSSQRGLPQGMATSVLLAELNIACLVRKLHACAVCTTIVYVDDINVIAFSLWEVKKCLDIVMDFIHAFRLSLSRMKSSLWGTDWVGLQELEATYGIKPVHTLEALGATWQLKPIKGVVYHKEESRLVKVRERLLRISHLPAHVTLKALVTSSTALSILDYLATPQKKHMHCLRKMVRKAIAIQHGAPEIVCNMPCTSMLDPMDRGFLTLLRLLVHAYNMPQFQDYLVSARFTSDKGRLAVVFREAASRGIRIEGGAITFGHYPNAPCFRLWAGWGALRKKFVGALKDLAFRNLQSLQ